MRTFVQVLDDPNAPRKYVHWKFQADTAPAYPPPNNDIRDATSVTPSPQEGWTANVDGTYAAPAVVPPPISPPRSLTPADFIQLVQTSGGMTDAQLVACKGDANFAAMWIKFSSAPALNRDDSRVQAGLSALETAAYITKPGGAAAVTKAWPSS